MLNIKDEFGLIKPKYQDGGAFVYVSPTHMAYKVDNAVFAYNVKDFGSISTFIARVGDVVKADDMPNGPMATNDAIDNTYSISNIKMIFEQIAISKVMFDFFNTIVSCGLSPLDVGTFSCKNGILEISYFNLEYCIVGQFSIPNKTLSFSSLINFNTIWYLYTFYKNYSVKKEQFNVNFGITDHGYIINYNEFYITFNDAMIHKQFVHSLRESIETMIGTLPNIKHEVLTKKFIVENNMSIYKNLTKCLEEEINFYTLDTCNILANVGIYVVAAKARE